MFMVFRKQKAEDPRDVSCEEKCADTGVTYVEMDPLVKPDKLREEGYTVRTHIIISSFWMISKLKQRK